MTHSVAWYDESQLLYVGVRIRGVGMQPELVSMRVGLTPTRTLAASITVERDLDGTDVDIDIPAEWIRETRTDPSPGQLLSQVDAALRELEATGVVFRRLDNARECEFCIGVLPGKNKRPGPGREEPPHELDQRIDALGLTLSVRDVYPGMKTGIEPVAIRSSNYWIAHGELRYVHIAFNGPALRPTVITAAIGLTPTAVTEPRVEFSLDIDGTEIEREMSGQWHRSVRTDPSPGAFEMEIEKVLLELEAVGDECRALRGTCDASMILGISPATAELMNETHGELPSSIMRRIEMLGFNFSIGAEFPGD